MLSTGLQQAMGTQDPFLDGACEAMGDGMSLLVSDNHGHSGALP